MSVHAIPYQRCGKVVVATSTDELPRLEELHRRGTANGVQGLAMIGPERLRELEPHATGLRALHVPSTGIIDFSRVAHTYARLVEDGGGTILLKHQVQQLRHSQDTLVLETTGGAIQTRYLINCGGLFCDRPGAPGRGRSPRYRSFPFGASIIPWRPSGAGW